MKILSIDTSSIIASASLLENDKIIGEISINNPKTHSQKLMSMIKTLFELSDMKIENVDRIVVANGPGSFTGLRIGISTAKGLAHPHNIKIAEVSALKGMAYNMVDFDGIICPMIDARRNQIYTAIYSSEKDGLKNVFEDKCILIDELIELLKKGHKKIAFLGDGVNSHKEIIKENFGDNAIFVNENNKYQRASSLAIAFIKEGIVSKKYDEVSAIYLRKTEAETKYEQNLTNKTL
ncbi:tRNA (adenosine(37)-N6)-threonylcarbamoyltransferase complex dimerization subunit type 1 TsaB [Helicovermis profundi]|uniref:tRNA (Adenosine(37)-N6)-threonylcarbamoyltransferase complex dimerization subunit type 1 TsaB n=1 Tax=Helicovermis profundi TaxID=3065157 RepID=A0AAU9E9J3_9FIRM|nr:tRNA (adenosine(37)-N6)-threonylcarbamoyltransferase complex dimerization subunit type 1 TsaB [Clostridia bacterium S502]